MAYPEVSIDQMSYLALHLAMKEVVDGQEIQTGSGTGFLYKNGGRYYLVSNWHVLTGLDPVTKRTKTARPRLAEIPILKSKTPIQWRRIRKALYEDEDMDKPLFLVHPEHGCRIDVAALPLNLPEGLMPTLLEDLDLDDSPLELIDDVYILGFPYRRTGGGNFPIVKRGSIASEPAIPIEELPKMYIDTASREGMSGAPVVYRRIGIHGLKNGLLTSKSSVGEIRGFVGVYSGRIKDEDDQDNLKAQLGIVWRKEVIDQIIDGGERESIDNMTN
ncbi:MAG: serine protease [Pseudomonadota bacterium]